MLLNCSCAKLANVEDFKTCLEGRFVVDTVYLRCECCSKFHSLSGSERMLKMHYVLAKLELVKLDAFCCDTV